VSDLYQPNTKQQLQMLREMTRLTGALHEVQVVNLKMWPLVLFTDAKTSSFTWDPDKKLVHVSLMLKPRHPTRKQAWWKERVGALSSWVHELLGDEWVTNVQIQNGKRPTIYRGTRKITDAGADSNSPDAS
jgi:hypothetical protein